MKIFKNKKHANSKAKNQSQSKKGLYAEALEEYFASQYVNRRRLYIVNFWRGAAFGLGSFLAATVGVVILIWVLSFFNNVPLIGHFMNTLQNTINNYSK